MSGFGIKIVTVKEMQELDRKAIEERGIPSLTLMENAGKAVSDIALDELKGVKDKKAAIFCGMGNNGGDGFVAARHLYIKGIDAAVYLAGKKDNLKNEPQVNARILGDMGISIQEIQGPVDVDSGLIVDAIFGIGLKGCVKGPIKGIISALNKSHGRVISVDVPSGLDADTGSIMGICVKADITVTMQFPKQGFYKNKGPEYAGKIVAVDIGI